MLTTVETSTEVKSLDLAGSGPCVLRDFAQRYRVKLHNTSTQLVAPGKYGEIADSYDDGDRTVLRLRLLAVPRGSAANDRALRSRMERARAGGMTLDQKAGAESIWLFDPANTGIAAWRSS